MKKEDIDILACKSKKIRLDVLRDIYRSKKGHIGGTYSCIDLFVYLYYNQNGLRYSSADTKMGNRDRLVVGKGHACLALYHIWKDLGIIPKSLVDLYGSNGSFLGGQLNIDTNGVEYNTGSLGNAVGIASGMAFSAKINNQSYISIALIGDGECSEGSIWESLEFASYHDLNNLIGVIDCNRFGVTDLASYSKENNKFIERIKSFGWDCYEIDGHNFEEIDSVFINKYNFKKPSMIIANTIKGKGVSFMEGGIKWHHSVPTDEEYEKALKEMTE